MGSEMCIRDRQLEFRRLLFLLLKEKSKRIAIAIAIAIKIKSQRLFITGPIGPQLLLSRRDR